MAEDRPGEGQQALAAAGSEVAGGRRAAIVVVGRDADERESLSGELSKRYSADYSIVVCDKPEELDLRMRDLGAMLLTGAGLASLTIHRDGAR